MVITQRKKLEKLIIDFCNHQGSRTFSLEELHDTYQDYASIGIGGQTPQATVRRLLQELRDAGAISFLDKSGHYTLRSVDFLKTELEDLNNIDFSKETPEKREYLMETYVRKVKWVNLAKEKLGTVCLMEDCGNTFSKPDGTPYIEVHHIIPLCDEGENSLSNLSVLCAHHHKMAHFAHKDKKIALRDYLLKTIENRIR